MEKATNSHPLISFENVYKTFGNLKVLNGLNFTVNKGETLVIIGQSGTGKSVTLRCLLGLIIPDKGKVLFQGNNIPDMNEQELINLRSNFGMLFQMAALFDSMTVGENVAFPIMAKGEKPLDETNNIVTETLRAVGLTGIEHKMPAELSGGMKKRVGLARAVASNPNVILYDEPTTGLDPITADAINELIISTQKQMKTTSIVVTHDMTSAYKVADRMIMLHQGVVVGSGTPDEIRNSDDPMIQQFINGRADGPIEI